MRKRSLFARRSQRGVTLIEATVSLGVFTLGLVGVLHLQMVAVRSNHMARKLALASTLAEDLVENASLWAYDDPRLVPGATIASPSDASVAARMGDSRTAAIATSSMKPHYAEGVTGDPTVVSTVAGNAGNPDALRGTNRFYDGLGLDTDRDGTSDFERYWSVFAVDSNSDGIEEGKLVLVVVRWFEAGVGYRRVTEFAFRTNWEVFSL